MAEPDCRDMLLRVLAAVEEGDTFDELDSDILEFWDAGSCFEGRVAYFKAKLELAEDFLMLARSPGKRRHGALTDDELAKLETT